MDKKIILSDKHANTMKHIEGVDPKFAKHMFLRNSLVENFAKHLDGGINILEQPVCPHCEKPAAWDLGGKGYCFSCNKSIPKDKVVTVREYLTEQLKGFSEDQLAVMSKLGGE